MNEYEILIKKLPLPYFYERVKYEFKKSELRTIFTIKRKMFVVKNKLKIVLLVWPLVLLLGVLLLFSYQRNQIDKTLLEADGLVWKAKGKQFAVHVNTHEDGELFHVRIEVVDPENKEVYTKTEVIDRDMFGGGFVRAVQVDQDSESEIVVWHARAKYYLDFSEGNVREVSFEQVSQQVKDLAKSWHKYNVMAGLETTILFISVFCYYILYGLIMGFLRLFKRKKRLK